MAKWWSSSGTKWHVHVGRRACNHYSCNLFEQDTRSASVRVREQDTRSTRTLCIRNLDLPSTLMRLHIRGHRLGTVALNPVTRLVFVSRVGFSDSFARRKKTHMGLEPSSPSSSFNLIELLLLCQKRTNKTDLTIMTTPTKSGAQANRRSTSSTLKTYSKLFHKERKRRKYTRFLTRPPPSQNNKIKHNITQQPNRRNIYSLFMINNK